MDKRNREFERLVAMLTEGELGDAQFRRLEEILASDSEARSIYCRQLQMHTLLLFDGMPTSSSIEQPDTAADFQDYIRRVSNQAPQTENATSHSPLSIPSADSASPISFGQGSTPLMLSAYTAAHQDRGSVPAPAQDRPSPGFSSLVFANLPRPSYVGAGTITIAIVIGCAMLVSVLSSQNRNSRNMATGIVAPTQRVRQTAQPAPDRTVAAKYVARVVRKSADCRWGNLSAPNEFLLRVRSGDRMHLTSGLVELEFSAGARIILHGPAIFTPTGNADGHLESGRLTGKVSDGNFRLVTPSAEVVDLGTEFGVCADAALGTDVVVFDGKVQVVSRSEGPEASEVVDMTEGMAARFHCDGTAEYGLRTEDAHFSRQIPVANDFRNLNELCLIDVFAGGDGFGKRLAGAIDPASGERDFGQLPVAARASDGTYHPVSWNPMIDGVFVPSREGRGVQVDSGNHIVDLPTNRGSTYGSLWARRTESAFETDPHVNVDFWGSGTLPGIIARLKTLRNGLVGMHSNLGVTIDLRTMRMIHRRAPQEFQAIVTNMDKSYNPARQQSQNVARTVDFRIFVDGDLRFERLGFGRKDGDQFVSVPLASRDRFLTFVVTDDGDPRFDHLVLIDPVVKLQEENK